ncbi:hypothetical protein A9Q83_18735 [Alphaproteobacteria bacterium 46_93_T64]|nr:hypothetical protein A9Q83_18735 [Alphaproteobacteria bacterium 46_93_T64]
MVDRNGDALTSDEQYLANSGVSPTRKSLADRVNEHNQQKAASEEDLSRGNIHNGSQTSYEGIVETEVSESSFSAPTQEQIFTHNESDAFQNSERSKVEFENQTDSSLEINPFALTADAENQFGNYSQYNNEQNQSQTEGLLSDTEFDNPLLSEKQEPQNTQLYNAAPNSVTLNTNSIGEDAAIGDVVGTVTAVDPESGTLSYSLSDDASGLFTIDASTGEIKVATGLDFETATSHSVTVDVSDGTNITQEIFNLNVGDVDEAAHSVALDTNSIDEGASVGDVVGTVSATDPESGTLSYSLSDNAGGLFNIDANTGEIKVAAGLDFETSTSHTVTVDVSDGTNVTQETFTLNVGDVDEAAHSVALDTNSIDEDASVGDVVGTVSATDPESGTLSYSLSDNAGGLFTIDANTGEIKVASGLDFETATSHSVTVDVSDGTNITQETFNLNVGDVDEAAHSVVMDTNSIDEGASVGDVVGTVTATDPESGTLSYSLSDNAGGLFTIDTNTGEIKVAGGLDFESSTSHTVTVDVSDGTNVTQETFNLNVGDVDEAAHSVALDTNSIDEDASVGDVVGTVSATDPESGALSYSLSDNAGGLFTIDANTGEIKVAAGLDFETATSHSVTVDVSDGTNVTQETFTLNVGDVDEAAHSVALDTSSIDEDAAIGDVVGTVSATDPESGTLSYSLSDNAGGLFTIDANTGEIKVAAGLDFETATSHSVTVDVSDGTNITQETFALNVGDVDEAAHSVALDTNSIDEDASVGDVVGTVSATDPESGTLSYSLSDDASGLFTIDASTGEIKVAGGLDFETETSHSVTVDVSDGINVTQETFTLNVGDVDEAMHSVVLDDSNIGEGAAIGDVVGTVSATDPESGTLAYSFSDDASGLFTIDAITGEITVAAGLDFETSTSHSVTVDVSDGTNVIQQSFNISVGDVDEAAHSVALDTSSIDEDASVGDVVGTVSATDPESGTLSYSLSDNAGGLFTIDANTGEIKVANGLDFETATSHSVTVDVSDGTNVTQQTFNISVDDNGAPVIQGSGNVIELDNIGETVNLSNMNVFPELNDSNNLEATVGTETFEDMVFDAENVVINYQSDLTITFQGEIAGYKNSIGAYQINEDGSVSAAQLLWGDASDGKLVAGTSTATYEDIEAGSTLGFFVISDGFDLLPDDATSGDGNTISETGTWMFVSPGFDQNSQNPDDHIYNINEDAGSPMLIYVEADGTIHTQSGDIFHSTNQEEFNPDTDANFKEHFVAGVDADNGILNFGFEDKLDGGDHDFNDGMFSVEIDVRDLVEAPNALFSKDNNGQSSFQISDTDNTELSSLVVTVSDTQVGDTLTIGGAYEVIGNEVFMLDGTPTGIVASIVEIANDITVTLSGDGDIDHYEAIIQNLNFSNDGSNGEMAGARNISVVATDSSGEESIALETTLTIPPVDGAAHSIVLDDSNIDEDAAIGDVVGTVSAVDPEGGALSFSLSDDASGLFTIDVTNGEIKVGGGLDFETATSHSITVDVSDGTNVTQQTFNIAVGDIAETVVPVDDPSLLGSANVLGTSGDDKAGSDGDLIGSDGADDIIYGLQGDDKLDGKQGEDILVGGEGSDTLEGGDDADSLFGGSGDDVLYGDKISGSSPDANDTLIGGDGADKLYGGSGDDILFGGDGDDEVYGNDGSDTFHFAGDEGNDKFYGGDGGGWSDTIVLSDGMPTGSIGDWLTLDTGSVQSSSSGEVFLSDDASGTITIDGVELTFEGVEKIEG